MGQRVPHQICYVTRSMQQYLLSARNLNASGFPYSYQMLLIFRIRIYSTLLLIYIGRLYLEIFLGGSKLCLYLLSTVLDILTFFLPGKTN